MKVYLVFKVGVYLRQCVGVFSTIIEAEQIAKKYIAGEKDDYHYYEIVDYELNEPIPQTPLIPNPLVKGLYKGGELEEPGALVTWNRNKSLVFRQHLRDLIFFDEIGEQNE